MRLEGLMSWAERRSVIDIIDRDDGAVKTTCLRGTYLSGGPYGPANDSTNLKIRECVRKEGPDLRWFVVRRWRGSTRVLIGVDGNALNTRRHLGPQSKEVVGRPGRRT